MPQFPILNPQSRVPFSLFISDLHLSPETTEPTDALLRFLCETAPAADALYVLGDLFEYWIGDEGLDQPYAGQIAKAFRALAHSGVHVCFMHGNRDFLIGARFAQTSGMQLLADPTLLTLYGTPTLLMHGDTLCRDDQEYQKFRTMVRDPAWQQAFLARPLDERIRMAREVRGKSEQAKQVKDLTIMDVAPSAVDDAFRAHHYARLIHGHTHRPAHHEHKVDGRVCERWVLADWYEHGSYLLCDADGCRAQPLN
jgi:UDP-2,3-diacylglucosamine hydrolase